MSHLDKDMVPEKVQEPLFKALLQRPENHQCADCPNKSPTWASIEFGVFLCIGCSGIHRQLGPHITRVKSSKLDKWKRDQAEIMTSVGNKLANDYYEYKLPKGFRRLDSTANPEEFARFVKDKYIKKAFAPPGYLTPVEEFLENKKKGLVVDLSFAKPGFVANAQQKVAPIVTKKSLPLEHPQTEQPKKEVPVQKATVNRTQAPTQSAPFDFLSSGDDITSHAQPTQPTTSSSTQNVNSNAQAEPSKASSAFDFDFSAIQQPTTQNQTQQQPQAQPQAQPQGQFQAQFQAQQQAANMPQQAQPESNSAPDIKKLYQQSNMYNNQYAMNPMMMGNNGFNPYGNMPNNAMYQNQMNQMYAQNNQGWNQGQVQGQGQGQFAGMNMNMNANMNMGNYGQVPNGMQQQMYQNNFNQQAFMQNNMYAQQQQQMNYPIQMQNNGFNQGMNYAQNSPTKFF